MHRKMMQRTWKEEKDDDNGSGGWMQYNCKRFCEIYFFSIINNAHIFKKKKKTSIFYASTTDAEMKQNYFTRSSSLYFLLARSAFTYVRAFNFTNEGVIRAQNTQETHKTNNNFSLDAHNNRTILKTQLRRCNIHGLTLKYIQCWIWKSQRLKLLAAFRS